METGYYWYTPKDDQYEYGNKGPRPVHVHEDGMVLFIGKGYSVQVKEMTGTFELIPKPEQ